MSAAVTHVATEVTREFIRLQASRDGRTEAWEWPAYHRQRGVRLLEKFLDFAADSRLVTYRARNLTVLLSQPEVLSRTRSVLGNLQDLFEGALLTAATAPDLQLPALAEFLGLDPEQDRVDLVAALPAALAPRFARLPREAHLLLQYVLGETTRLDYLPWPTFTPEELRTPLAALEKLAPRVPAGKRFEPEITGRQLPDLARELLSPGGPIAALHPEYEERAAQIAMAGAVAETFTDGGLLMVEAGTGVGKSLAYLVPSLLWAREHGKPVLVSTNTRNLQDQLLNSEVPLLTEALPVSFRATLLKGRRNYPCLRSLLWLLSEAAQSLFWSERLAAAYVISWLADSPGGDLESMAPEALDELEALPGLLQRVRSQADGCSGAACPLRASCRVEQVRAQARASDLIITNHALTLEETRFPFLPETTHVVFDEAHNLESAATENLAYELNSGLVYAFLSALGGEGKSLGLIETLTRRLQPHNDLVGVKVVLALLPGLPQWGQALGEAADLLGQELASLSPPQRRTRGGGDRERNSIRLTRALREDPAFFPIADALQRFRDTGQDCQAELETLVARLREIHASSRPELAGLDAEALVVAGRLGELLDAAGVLAESAGDEEQYVSWAEAWERQGRIGWSLRAAPINVGPLLRELFYDRKTAVVFTSATLTIEGQFRHFRRRLGLDFSAHNRREESYPSPFQLTEQLLLCVPRDFPDPKEPRFDETVTETLARICEVSQGGTLALFTSRARMEAAFEELEDSLTDLGLRPLAQEVSGPRWWLLEQLRQHDNTVLFGLKSFWEGVDVPGSALRCVVLCKLPFAVPDDPLVAARMEAIERDGGNAMAEYYFPEAILGFKQGLGRLIRRQTDRGVVFVLDPRLLTRNYGPRFFRSIQRCGLVRETLETCLEQSAEWLEA